MKLRTLTLAALGLTLAAFVATVLDERFPAAIKATLNNGGGDIIRGIVREENEAQSKAHREMVLKEITQAITAHAEVERRDARLDMQQLVDEHILGSGRRCFLVQRGANAVGLNYLFPLISQEAAFGE